MIHLIIINYIDHVCVNISLQCGSLFINDSMKHNAQNAIGIKPRMADNNKRAWVVPFEPLFLKIKKNKNL